jgi:alpha-tubulin suppressor-like RCC1 family protein
MKKRQNRTRFLMTALPLAFAAILAAACNSPTSSTPDAPVTPPQTNAYDVTYFGNANTAGDAPVDTAKYAYGKDSVTLMERGNLYRVGYSFTGWNTQADGSGVLHQPGAQIPIKGPIELYAQWAEVFPKISAGDYFSTLVTKEGNLYAAGYNGNGRLGDGTNNNRQEFTAIKTNIQEPVRFVSSGTDHSFAILQSGNIAGWGQGDYGKLGINQDNAGSTVPQIPSFSSIAGTTFLGKIEYVSVGRSQTALLNDRGEYWAAGNKTYGALGNGPPVNNVNREKQFKFITNEVTSMAAGNNYILLIKKDGTMWLAGEGANGKLGTAGTVTVSKLRKNTAIDNSNLMVFAGKSGHSMVLQKDGRILSAGSNNYGQLGHGDTEMSALFDPVINSEDTELTDVAFASLGDGHSMILKKDGTLWATGRNTESQLGISSTGNQLKAVLVLENVAHVAAGYTHTLAVKEDGSLWAAGSNYYGQFGQRTSNTNSLWTEIDISTIVNPAAPVAP